MADKNGFMTIYYIGNRRTPLKRPTMAARLNPPLSIRYSIDDQPDRPLDTIV